MSKVVKTGTGYFSENNTRYVWLDGRVCQHINDCYSYLQDQLSLPDYFGKNLDALEEILADLDWIAEEKICIVILHPSELLAKETKRKNDFMEILNNCSNKKIKIVYVENAAHS